MRRALSESGAVAALLRAAMDSRDETTLKATLSALWNMSAHSVENRSQVCEHPNALVFLVSLVDCDTNASSSAIVENAV